MLLTDGQGMTSRRELLESSSEIIVILKNQETLQQERSLDHFTQISMLVQKMPESNMIKPCAFCVTDQDESSVLALEKEGTIFLESDELRQTDYSGTKLKQKLPKEQSRIKMVDVNKGPSFLQEIEKQVNMTGEAGKQTPAKFKAQSQKRLTFEGEDTLNLTEIQTKEEDDSHVDRAFTSKLAASQLNQPFVANKVLKSTQIFGDQWNAAKHDSRWFHEVDENLEIKNPKQKLMAQAILIFHGSHKKGIWFCIQNDLIQDTHTDIANFLKNTYGLDRDQIGLYLSAPDKFQQSVLHEYTSLFNFQNKPMVDAIREYLSTFNPPGESQIMERFMFAFSLCYYKSNPTYFQKQDEAEALALGIIFLQTEFHNKSLRMHVERTKESFLKDFSQLVPKYPKHLLGDIYDSIKSKEIKNINSALQTALSRVKPFNGTIYEAEQLNGGQVFVKFCRTGQPHARYVYICPDEKYVVWCVKEDPQPQQSGGQQKRERHKRRILISDIIDVKVGVQGSRVLKRHKLSEELDHLFFSLLTKDRSLDLQAQDQKTRNKWVKFFHKRLEQMIPQLTHVESPYKVLENKSDEEITKVFHQECPQRYLHYHKYFINKGIDLKSESDLRNLWETEIMTNFEKYWDYTTHKPRCKQVSDFRQLLAESPSNLLRTWCLSPAKARQKRVNRTPNDELQIYMDDFWRFGIPRAFRRVLWPFITQNKLQISERLYEIIREQSRNKQLPDRVDSDITNFYNCIESNMKYEVVDRESKVEQSKNIIRSFLCYRPDVECVTIQNLAYLVGTFLEYCDELEAFILFCNMMHQNYFPLFLQGKTSDYKFRLQLFELFFKENLPDLFQHFKSFQIDLNLFVTVWMQTIFLKAMDFKIASRVLDNYFLDGEIFVFKTGIAILTYFEPRFLKQAKYDIESNLLNMRGKLDEQRLFAIIEDQVNIETKTFNDEIKKQQWSQDKGKVFRIFNM